MSFMLVNRFLKPFSKFSNMRVCYKVIKRDLINQNISQCGICLFSSDVRNEREKKKVKLHFDGNNFKFRMLFTFDFYRVSTFKLFCKIYGITAFLAHNVLYYVYYYGFYWLLEHGVNVKRFIAFFFQMPTFAPYVNSIPEDTRAASLAIAAVLTTIILPLRIFVTCLVSVPIVHYLRSKGLMKPAGPIITTTNLKGEGKFELNPPFHKFPDKCPTKYDKYFKINKDVIYTLPFYDKKAKIIDNSYRKRISDKITEISMKVGHYLYLKCEKLNEYLRQRRERRKQRIIKYLNNKKNIVKMKIKRYLKNKKDRMNRYIRRKTNEMKQNIKNAIMNKIKGNNKKNNNKNVTALVNYKNHSLTTIPPKTTAIQNKINAIKDVNKNNNHNH